MRDKPVTIIGDSRESTRPAYCQPGTASLQIAPAEYRGLVGPPVRVLRRPFVELIAICRQQQAVFRIRSPRKNDQAHEASKSDAIDPVVNEASGNRQTIRQLRKARLQLLAREPLGVLELAVVQSDFGTAGIGDESQHQR